MYLSSSFTQYLLSCDVPAYRTRAEPCKVIGYDFPCCRCRLSASFAEMRSLVLSRKRSSNSAEEAEKMKSGWGTERFRTRCRLPAVSSRPILPLSTWRALYRGALVTLRQNFWADMAGAASPPLGYIWQSTKRPSRRTSSPRTAARASGTIAWLRRTIADFGRRVDSYKGRNLPALTHRMRPPGYWVVSSRDVLSTLCDMPLHRSRIIRMQHFTSPRKRNAAPNASHAARMQLHCTER